MKEELPKLKGADSSLSHKEAFAVAPPNFISALVRRADPSLPQRTLT